MKKNILILFCTFALVASSFIASAQHAPIIEGKLTAYAALAEDQIDDVFLLYVRQGDGPMIKLTEDNLEAIVKDNEKAEKLLKKKKYTRAINKYNGAAEKAGSSSNSPADQ